MVELRKTFTYVRRVLEPGELSNAFRAAFDAVGVSDPANIRVSMREVLADGTNADHNFTLTEIDHVCDPGRQSVFVTTRLDTTPKLYISINGDGDSFSVSYSGTSAEVLARARKAFEQVLNLEELSRRSGVEELAETLRSIGSQAVEPLEKRLEALEVAVFSPARKLRCFLSFRFSDENELVALRIQQFLNLIGVEVLTGASYEPRQVSEKVLSKLREPLDFIVLLVTRTGESMWTRDEIGTAVHKGIALVPLVEQGSTFAKGLFADVEYAEFETGHIGDVFLKLLQAVNFIREQSAAVGKADEVHSLDRS